MDWGSVVGRTGWVKTSLRTYEGKEYMDIKQWLAPDEAPQGQPQAAPLPQYAHTQEHRYATPPATPPQQQYQQPQQQQGGNGHGGYSL